MVARRQFSFLLLVTSLLLAGALVMAALQGQLHSTLDAIDALQQQFADVAATRDYAKLEALAEEYRHNHSRTAWGGWMLEFFYSGILEGDHPANVQHPAALQQFIADWKQYAPNSVTPRIIEGEALLLEAWKVRGNWPARQTAPEKLARFEELLREARTKLLTAESFSRTDPHLYATLLFASKGLSLSRNELFRIYDRGAIVEPSYYPLNFRMAENLLPQWGGAAEEGAQFASYAAAAVGGADKNIIYAKIAYLMLSGRCEVEYARRFSTERVEAGFNEVLRRYPGYSYNIHQLAYVLAAQEDWPRARNAFGEISWLQWDRDAKEIWFSWVDYFTTRLTALFGRKVEAISTTKNQFQLHQSYEFS